MRWCPFQMCSRRGMYKHTRKFQVYQYFKNHLHNSFTIFPETKFSRLQSALPCWFPVWCPTWKMFWYLLKHIYFIVQSNCILMCIILWCSIWDFLNLSFSMSGYFWHCNFSVQVHCWKSVSIKFIKWSGWIKF
jgi:hypothetical protein